MGKLYSLITTVVPKRSVMGERFSFDSSYKADLAEHPLQLTPGTAGDSVFFARWGIGWFGSFSATLPWGN